MTHYSECSRERSFFLPRDEYNGGMHPAHIASANDLTGADRRLYRALEILPGALAWTTLVGVVVLSWLAPVVAAIFIIVFDLYWLIKTIFLSFHLRAHWARFQRHLKIDWSARLSTLQWGHLWQLVILPRYKEDIDVVTACLESLVASTWPRDRMMVVLALEVRAGADGDMLAAEIERRYAGTFGRLLVTRHPADLEGELPGKGANETWAARQAVASIIDAEHIPYESVLVSSLDIDTQIYPQYFTCLAYHFLTAEKPFRSSFQPVPIYNNNIWDTPALSRVVAGSGTFWQMMQQERPERLTTFSSHSMSLKSLAEIGYWQKNIVSEDSRIFWNHFFAYDGDYQVVPLGYPVSLDANLAPTFLQTMRNVYKQQRRWGWGVENVPYVLFNFIRNKKISFKQKWYFTVVLLEGFWSWATNALIIFMLGWLPLTLGGRAFNTSLLSYNLPHITRALMTFAMVGMISSAIVSTKLLPPRPEKYGRTRSFSMVLQWILMPLTIIVFGSIPGIEAQTRLMLGGRWRLGFWVTPKHRK